MQQLKHSILVTTMLMACAGCGGQSSSSPGPTSVPVGSATPPAGSTRINDTDPSILYSKGNHTIQDWDYIQAAAEDYQQDEHSSNFVRSGGAITGVAAVVNFTGTGITWVGKKGPGYGKATYSVDGGAPQTVDNYNSTELDQDPLVTVSGLSADSHVLSISLLDQKNAAATDYWQTIDGFDVGGSPLTPAQATVAGYNSAELY